MADNYLITGYWGEPHVTAENDRGINAAIFGTGRFVLPVGEQFRAEYIGNNTIRMYDGKLMDNGAAAGIPVGEYVDLLIANAKQGMKRNDLIVFQYELDSSTLIESGKFVVVQGEETTGEVYDPELEQDDLLSGNASFDQMPLWRVPVFGTTISAPEPLFGVSQNIKNAGVAVAEATSSDGITYHATIPGVTEYRFGYEVIIIPKITSKSNMIKLAINDLSEKSVLLPLSSNTSRYEHPEDSWYFSENRPIKLRYTPNGTVTGFWSAVDRILQSASDLYGEVPINKGGTGAETLEKAQKNLQIYPAEQDTENPGHYYRTVDGEKEWINPPMTVGVEYRTTERFMGAPVYTSIAEGTVPASGTSSKVRIAMGVTGLIRYNANVFNSAAATPYFMPLNVTPEISTTILRVNVDNSGGALTAGEHVVAQAWYTREDLA